MKNQSISKSLVPTKANAKRTVMALLLGFATLSLTVCGMSSTARAQNGAPANIHGTWLTAITRINQGGVAEFHSGRGTASKVYTQSDQIRALAYEASACRTAHLRKC